MGDQPDFHLTERSPRIEEDALMPQHHYPSQSISNLVIYISCDTSLVVQGGMDASLFAGDGYPFDSPSPKGLCFADRFFTFPMNDLVAGHRIDGDGLLSEAKEQLSSAARLAPVESKRELVQIVVQMLVADRTLMRSH